MGMNLTAVSLFAEVGSVCKKCGSDDLTDFDTPAWYKNRVVLCGTCDRVSVIEQ